MAAVAAALIAGCSGPLDSPMARPPATRDAATDLRRDLPVDHGTGGAGGKPDAGPDAGPDADAGSDAADAGRPDGSLPDTAIDGPTPLDAGSWPVVPGCTTGRQPAAYIDPTSVITDLTVGCGPLVRVLARLSDRAAQGLVFDAKLDPPVSGFELSHGPVCADQSGADIRIYATGMTALQPGQVFSTFVRVTVQGPASAMMQATWPLAISVVPTDFMFADQVVDFGTVAAGTSTVMRDLMVLNNVPSAPLAYLYWTTTMISPAPFALNQQSANPDGAPLEPGMSGSLLTAVLSPLSPGTFESVFFVSPFPPGSVIDPGCGTISKLTLRAQVVPRGLP